MKFLIALIIAFSLQAESEESADLFELSSEWVDSTEGGEDQWRQVFAHAYYRDIYLETAQICFEEEREIDSTWLVKQIEKDWPFHSTRDLWGHWLPLTTLQVTAYRYVEIGQREWFEVTFSQDLQEGRPFLEGKAYFLVEEKTLYLFKFIASRLTPEYETLFFETIEGLHR